MLSMYLIPFLASTTPVTSLSTLSTVFTQIVNWMIEFVGLISNEPLLLVGLAILVVGMIVGLAFRAVRGKGRR